MADRPVVVPVENWVQGMKGNLGGLLVPTDSTCQPAGIEGMKKGDMHTDRWKQEYF